MKILGTPDQCVLECFRSASTRCGSGICNLHSANRVLERRQRVRIRFTGSAAAPVPEADFAACKWKGAQRPRRVFQISVLTQHPCFGSEGDRTCNPIGHIYERIGPEICEVLRFTPDAIRSTLILQSSGPLIQLARNSFHRHDKVQIFARRCNDGRAARRYCQARKTGTLSRKFPFDQLTMVRGKFQICFAGFDHARAGRDEDRRFCTAGRAASRDPRAARNLDRPLGRTA